MGRCTVMPSWGGGGVGMDREEGGGKGSDGEWPEDWGARRGGRLITGERAQGEEAFEACNSSAGDDHVHRAHRTPWLREDRSR